MRVLIVSPFIDPQAVGEPRWCYDLAVALTQRHDCTILSQRPVNRDFGLADLFPGVATHEAPAWPVHKLPRRLNALLKPNYVRFYRFAREWLGKPENRSGIACAHHFGPLGMRYPTPLYDAGIPYVFGPLGGSLQLPPGLTGRPTREPWYYRLRDFDAMRFRHDPLLRASYANAAVLVGVAGYVRDLLPDLPLRRFETFSEIAAKPPREGLDAIVAARKGRAGPLRFLCVSRLIFTKGVQYALRALAERRDALPDWRLDVLGDGVYRPELARLTADLGLADRVVFHGHVARQTVDDHYRDADAFLFPTVREPSGAVLFEAISWGLPVVTVDYGGPGTHADASFAIKASVENEARLIAELGDAIEALATSPELRERLGAGAVAAARSRFGMDAMVDFYDRLYRDIRA
jgi:glycosyltransferase involved in cell wall biosynthesis